MAAETVTVNVTHRLSWLGKFVLYLAVRLAPRDIYIPMPFIVWVINHTSYVRVDKGKWKRTRLNIRLDDVEDPQ